MKPAQFEDLKSYLAQQENKSLLRFLTCGSVDDGKSTLIGRLLFDSKLIFEDHLSALAKDSRKHGTTGEDIDLALLVDGLEAERQQGITIDVAYRFFATDKRKFIVADTPGHEQYTRNMATGASNSELAVILIDARKGVLTQTRRHAYIVSLLGIRHVVLAVNKIDLVGFSQSVFTEITDAFRAFASKLGFETLVPIPLSARYGDNVIAQAGGRPGTRGPALLDHLETIDVETELDGQAVPHAGAMGEPAQSRFPRLCRVPLCRAASRPATKSWSQNRAPVAGDPLGYGRWRYQGGGGGAGGHAGAGR